MIRVQLPSQLQSYCAGQTWVEADGATIGAVLDDLDRQFPGLRFRVIDEQERVRPHMRLFANREPAVDLAMRMAAGDELMIFGALSGG